MEILKLPREATVDDLYELDQKAELINGEIVLMPPTGFLPSRASGAIYRHLYAHEKSVSGGYAIPNNAGFIVDLPQRKSFSPDAAWYTGHPTRGQFLQGAPTYAAEVRSEGDYELRAEREIQAKRSDYFTAGTRVVWDVDVLRAEEIRVYRAESPDTPVIYRRGETAELEPAVPGWRFPVEELWD
jgi:Uma2 family endonuclease